MALLHNLRQTPNFLNKLPDFHLEFLAKDMSTRCYYRLRNQVGDSFVLMDAPPPENPAQFVRISNYLRSYGCSAPEVLYEDYDNGFLLLEDFGDNTFTNILKKYQTCEIELYKTAVYTLKHLQMQAVIFPTFVQVYSLDQLVNETCLLLEWYWPYIKKTLISKELQDEYRDLWQKAFKYTLDMPSTLVLRDFHVDNLIYLDNRSSPQNCGLLDFQDAIWGPKIIDLVSLLEDARRDIDENLIESMWSYYLQDVDVADHSYWRDCGAILSAGRHARIIGVFTRYMVKYQNPKYLSHLPRLWGLLKKCLAHPQLHFLNKWFDLHLNIDYQMKKIA